MELPSVEPDESIFSRVGSLLNWSLPFAIRLAVIPIIVLPSDGHPGRPFSHVFQETGEHMPFFANAYTAPAVLVVGWVASVFASLNHARPCSVSGTETSTC